MSDLDVFLPSYDNDDCLGYAQSNPDIIFENLNILNESKDGAST
jgi:hypothetical protein